jgi:hypothetical protein
MVLNALKYCKYIKYGIFNKLQNMKINEHSLKVYVIFFKNINVQDMFLKEEKLQNNLIH